VKKERERREQGEKGEKGKRRRETERGQRKVTWDTNAVAAEQRRERIIHPTLTENIRGEGRNTRETRKGRGEERREEKRREGKG